MVTGELHTMTLNTTQEKLHQWIIWNRGPGTPYIQDYFPELSAEEREFLLTGITPEFWDEIREEENGE